MLCVRILALVLSTAETKSLLSAQQADTIRLAHSTGYMQKSELWEDEGDEAFWLKMTDSKNAEVRKLASKVTKTTRVQEISESESEECLEECYHKERAKIRTIDPDVLQKDGSVFKLSALSEEYKLARAAYLKRKSGEKWYRIIEK